MVVSPGSFIIPFPSVWGGIWLVLHLLWSGVQPRDPHQSAFQKNAAVGVADILDVTPLTSFEFCKQLCIKFGLEIAHTCCYCSIQTLKTCQFNEFGLNLPDSCPMA